MKRLLLSIFIVLLLASVCNAGMIIQTVASGVSCTSGVSYIAHTDTTDSGIRSLTADAAGQSITTDGSGAYLHSISIYSGYSNAASATMRIGTSTDLSTYVGEATVSGQSTGWITFDFSASPPQLSASTVYYFGVIETAGDMRWNYDAPAVSYAGGTEYLLTGASGWSLGDVGTGDMLFEVFECQ